MKNLLAPIFLLILFAACGPGSYTKKQLREQPVPTALKMKGWSLEKIIQQKDSVKKYPDGNTCRFTFRFEPQGNMGLDFAEVKQRGVYTISNNQLCNLFVLNYKVMYTEDKQCDSMTFGLGIILSDTFRYEVKGETLILTGSHYTMFLKAIIT